MTCCGKSSAARGTKGSTAGVAASAATDGASPETPSADNQELLARIVDGDQRAYALFYDRNAPRVLGLLIRSLRHRADAEDVLQETFQQVWRSASQYSSERSSPEAWVSLIARSRLVDFLRRRRFDACGALLHAQAPHFDPAAKLMQDETAASVNHALVRLPEAQRVAISLAYFDGLTHQQIARRQDIPLGTAKTRILLGMRSLRNLLSALDGVA